MCTYYFLVQLLAQVDHCVQKYFLYTNKKITLCFQNNHHKKAAKRLHKSIALPLSTHLVINGKYIPPHRAFCDILLKEPVLTGLVLAQQENTLSTETVK